MEIYWPHLPCGNSMQQRWVYGGHANNDDDDDADVHESFKSDQTKRMEIAQDPSIEMRKLYIY